jgi:hypothetical protein
MIAQFIPIIQCVEHPYSNHVHELQSYPSPQNDQFYLRSHRIMFAYMHAKLIRTMSSVQLHACKIINTVTDNEFSIVPIEQQPKADQQ